MLPVKITKLIKGRLIREGAGVKLQRYIGLERTNDLEPLLLLDYFDSCDPLDFMAGFPPHPHRGFETITYLWHGAISHEDNKGHKGRIAAGDVQWMTAGRGIVHSEMPDANSPRLQGLQLWLNLPAAEKMCPPRYQEYAGAELPLEQHASGAVVKIIAGSTDKGTCSPISGIATKPLFFELKLPAQSQIQQSIPAGYSAVLLLISGQANIEGQTIEALNLASLTNEGGLLTIEAEQDSVMVLIAARILAEPIVRHGPFVMNTQEEIISALNDFRSGQF